MSVRRAPVVGFVGGIGSGKSAVANWLGAKLGAVVLNADEAGHRALERKEVKERIRERFGPDVFDEAGAVIRSRLAARVFGAGEPEQTARRQLEQIVHPVIRRDLEQQIAQNGDTSDLILLDAAVLLESGWHDVCNALVYVDVSPAVRQERVLRTRNWTSEQLASREASQLPLSEKRAAADLVINNSGSIEQAGQQFLDWYQNWRRSHRNGGDGTSTD
jgi:dephospho-CoA kinase